MKPLAIISGLAVVAFMVAYSLDLGCFICLSEEQRGGNAEKWINAGLGVIALNAGAAFVWRKFRRRDGSVFPGFQS